MRPNFTHEQLAAIEARTGSSLLAANAGSGKTAVMVERIAEAIRKDGIPGRYVNGDVSDGATLEARLQDSRAIAAQAAADLRAGRITPCPDRCGYQGGCAHPGICRS